MMQQIGDELQDATGALTINTEQPEVLDLCMAPGGYALSALKYNTLAHVSGITLPEENGGHRVMVRHGHVDGHVDAQIQVAFLDITMLIEEFGVTKVPDDHPDKDKFLHGSRPYLGKTYDLIFCDGQVLRTHNGGPYWANNEPLRLSCSQLIFALQHIRIGGTLIMLLHKVEACHSVELLYTFSKFASIRLFKPIKKHALRSSFYLVAQNILPQHPTAISAVSSWKEAWKLATFSNEPEIKGVGDIAEMTTMLADFGAKLVELAEPVWMIQRDASARSHFTRANVLEST